MADETPDPASGELIPRDPSLADFVTVEIDGVSIPFAGAELLYRMKIRAGREKDRGDIHFLKQVFAAQGKQPPDMR